MYLLIMYIELLLLIICLIYIVLYKYIKINVSVIFKGVPHCFDSVVNEY